MKGNTLQNKPRGIFIVFEGIDGSGKTTQSKLLCEELRRRGVDAVWTREPTDGEWGKKIRGIAAGGREGTTLEEELSWFLNDREEHLREEVIPALERGAVVVCDRYYHSTMAYQGALGLDPEHIRRLNEETREFPKPDLVIYVYVEPGRGRGRIDAGREGGANVGYEKLEFLEKVKEIFDSMSDPAIKRIDGEATIEEVFVAVMELAEEAINNKSRAD